MGISEKAVEKHLGKLLAKPWGVSRVEAAVWAVERGLVAGNPHQPGREIPIPAVGESLTGEAEVGAHPGSNFGEVAL